MHDHLIEPFWGNAAIIAISGTITLACFVAMFWLLFHPGEKNPRHVKYDILRKDR